MLDITTYSKKRKECWEPSKNTRSGGKWDLFLIMKIIPLMSAQTMWNSSYKVEGNNPSQSDSRAAYYMYPEQYNRSTQDILATVY